MRCWREIIVNAYLVIERRGVGVPHGGSGILYRVALSWETVVQWVLEANRIFTTEKQKQKERVVFQRLYPSTTQS
jgi:hypothetical protein